MITNIVLVLFVLAVIYLCLLLIFPPTKTGIELGEEYNVIGEHPVVNTANGLDNVIVGHVSVEGGVANEKL